MAKKPKLLSLKEARERCESLTKLVLKQDVRINGLENDLKSMTGARDNCKTMHEFNAKLVDEKNQEICYLENAVKNQRLTVEDLKSLRAHDRRKLDGYSNESAVSLVKRGLAKLVAPIRLGVVNLVARLKFK